MKTMRLLACLGLVVIATSAQAKDETKKKAIDKSMNAVFVEAKDIQWKDNPEFPGLQTADVEGDSTKGPSHMFMKFKPGFTAPLHHHTANFFVAVINGTFVLTTEDGVEHRLPAGSYFSFKNKTKHTTKCAEGADCIIFGDMRAKWDVVPAKQME